MMTEPCTIDELKAYAEREMASYDALPRRLRDQAKVTGHAVWCEPSFVETLRVERIRSKRKHQR